MSQSNDVPPSNDGGQQKQKDMLLSDSERTGHFSMVKALHLADLVTLLNGFSGVMSVFSSMRYCLGDPEDYWNINFAIICIWAGFFFDAADGRIARWRKKSSLMGQELDSLADLVSFGLSPAAVAFALGLRTTVDHCMLAYFVLCGLTRLARYNVTVTMLPKDASGKSKYFEGLPIPTSLGTSLFMGYWVRQDWTHSNLPFGLAGEGTFWEFHPISLLFFLHGCLMISKTLRIPKP